MFGIQVGQTLDIVNSDATLHNIHALPMANQRVQPRRSRCQGMKHTHVFSTKEVMVPFKCDVHKWMNAYVGVLDHPFFAVSGSRRRVRADGLPPGTYTIEAVHEKLGTQTQRSPSARRKPKTSSFTFKSLESAQCFLSSRGSSRRPPPS